jgi:putative (di)nucleoside polyphosphate hydrolase
MILSKELPLRTGVGIILLNKENKVFVGRRIDNPKKFWQMPQGGVEKNESFFQAAKRELKEETGIKSVKLIKKIDGWYIYNLPKILLGKIWKGKYRGQKQKWFIMEFVGDEKEININTKNPEFLDWKWIDVSELTKVAVNFKIHIYEKITEELNSLNFS